MSKSSFNDGWRVRPMVSIFAQLQGADDAEELVRLPHDAQFALERSASAGEGAHDGYFPSAAFQYLKTFEVPLDYREKRVSIEFEGVYRDAMVYVNGDFAAQRPNGFSSFSVALDPYLMYGEQNTIRVDARAHSDSRWYTGVGIHRDTFLVVSDLVHLAADGIRINTPDVDDERAVVVVATTLVNDSRTTRTVQLETTVTTPDGTVAATDLTPVTLRAGAFVTARQRLYVKAPQRWSVESPSLYRVLTSVRADDEVIEDADTSFGIRTIQLDPQHGLRINGKTVKLRGACIHSDNGLLGAAAIGRAEERRVELLKAAGFNAIRSSHNPMSRAMLDACDRLGVLVMDETFDIWTEGKSAFDYSLNFPEWWERDIESLVGKDYNHPSVILYSIGNEIPETGTPLGSELGRRLVEKVRSLDGTRLITNAINGFVSVIPDVVAGMKARAASAASSENQGGVNELMGGAGAFMNQISASPLVSAKTAESYTMLDVAGVNYGDGRYELDKDLFPNRVIVGTETFPTHIDVNWGLVEANDHVIGDFTWTGWDYLGEAGIGRVQYSDEGVQFAAPFPWMLAWCGDIDITGHRRPASYYRETVFGLRHAPYIAVRRPANHGRQYIAGQWTWSDSISSWTWDSEPGSPVTVEVYSDADEVELSLNGHVIGRESVGRENQFRAIFETSYEQGELTATSYIDGLVQATTRLCTANGQVGLDVKSDRSAVRADSSDLAFVSIEFRDADGVIATNVKTAITVAVEGAGVLRALGSARPDPTERYDTDTHTPFDGRALAIIRPTEAGIVTVTARAEGYEPATVVIEVSAT